MKPKTRASQAARFVLIITALLLPSLSLLPLGGFYLWEKGYLLIWAIASAVTVSLVYAAQTWLFASPELAAVNTSDEPTPDIHPTWTPREEQSWADVRAIAAKVDIDQITSTQAVIDLGHRTINAVANRIHADKDDAVLHFTIPEALAISERVSSRLSAFIHANIPFGDRLTVAQVVQIYRWRSVVDMAERAYDFWRILRLSNPAAAITNEARERLSRAMIQWGRDHISRRLAETFVEEVGRAAIDLYGGRLRLTHDDLGSAADAAVNAAGDLPILPTEPLHLLIVAEQNGVRAQLEALVSGMERARAEAVTAFVRGEDVEEAMLRRPALQVSVLDMQKLDAVAAKSYAPLAASVSLVLLATAQPDVRSDYERDALDLVREAADLVPPVIVSIDISPHDDDFPTMPAGPPPLITGSQQRQPVVQLHLDLARPDRRSHRALWQAIEGSEVATRRIQLIRRLDRTKNRRDWVGSARQAVSAAGSLTKSLWPRRRPQA
jgi:hypothetical protein